MLLSFSFWQLFFHGVSFVFAGFVMKALLSLIFELSYNSSYLESSNLAAIGLVGFAVVRGILPYATRHLRLIPVCAGMTVVNTFLYALSPTIIAKLPVEWLVASKVITGASFAGLGILQNLLAVEVYGASEFAIVYPYISFGTGLGFAFGPFTGYSIYLTGSNGGENESSRAFDGFFYTCAIITAADFLNLLLLSKRAKPSPVATGKS